MVRRSGTWWGSRLTSRKTTPGTCRPWRTRAQRRDPSTSSGPVLIGLGGRRFRSGAWPPQAHQPGDEGDQEHLSDQHLEDREDLAKLTGGNQIAVAGGGEGRVAEEQIVPAVRIRSPCESVAAV